MVETIHKADMVSRQASKDKGKAGHGWHQMVLTWCNGDVCLRERSVGVFWRGLKERSGGHWSHLRDGLCARRFSAVPVCEGDATLSVSLAWRWPFSRPLLCLATVSCAPRIMDYGLSPLAVMMTASRPQIGLFRRPRGALTTFLGAVVRRPLQASTCRPPRRAGKRPPGPAFWRSSVWATGSDLGVSL